MQDTSLVPFGKYKNQPLAVLAQDRGYREWLLAQDWFVQRYPNIHTIIINNFGEPAETPKHNALQLRFLQQDVRERCTAALLAFRLPYHVLASIDTPVFEDGGHDVSWSSKIWECREGAEYWIHGAWEKQPPGWKIATFQTLVECKPSLGDDYPQVLRFMKSLRVHGNVLCVGDYAFRGGSLTEVRQFFAASHILLISLHELLDMPVPNIVPPSLPDFLPDPATVLAAQKEAPAPRRKA